MCIVAVNVCACSLHVTAGPNTAWGFRCCMVMVVWGAEGVHMVRFV
jgi:hypothetical protein